MNTKIVKPNQSKKMFGKTWYCQEYNQYSN